MKRTLALLIGMMISASVARGGDVTVNAVMTSGPKDKPTTIFTPDAPKVLVLFKTKGVQKGDKLRGVWIADDVGAAAPANTKIDEKTLTLEGDTEDGDFSCSKPNTGWPPGKYHVDIYANDKLTTTVKFTIEAGEKTTAEKPAAEKPATEKTTTKKTEKESEESDDDADDSDDDQYTFKVHNANVQRITKLLASENGKDYANFDIGKGIDVGETVRLNWDKSTNKSGCKWYLKAVYADKSVGEAVKFDFCQEDLIIDF
jgi:hypothetical protein